MSRAIFLDRDGVINIERDYLYKIEDFEFIDGVFEAMKHFQKLNYRLFIITNQSGIGRGYYSLEDFEKLTNWMLEQFKKEGIKIDRVYFCPHTPKDNCNCRKPNPTNLFDARDKFNIDLKNSWIIGDKESDIESGLNAQIENTILVRSGHKIDEVNTKAKFIVNSISDVIDLVKD